MDYIENFMMGIERALKRIPTTQLFMEKGFVLEQSTNSLGIMVHWKPDKSDKNIIEVEYCLKDGPLKNIKFNVYDFGEGKTDLLYIVFETVQKYDVYEEGDEIVLLERYSDFKNQS